MRNLASVQKILNIEPIIGADAIEKATILGWQCVVAKKDNFKVGDLVVYIEIDSILPEKPEFEFLRPRKFRIKTIKLKGQVSQGLVLPLSILPEGKYVEGTDVTEIIGVKKYDPQLELENRLFQEKIERNNNKINKFFSRFPWYRKLFFKPNKSTFPKFIKKTDEDRIQLFTNICERQTGVTFDYTEKLDGQSATYFLVQKPKLFGVFNMGYEFGVCSRNLHLPKEDSSSYWTIAKQYNIEQVLRRKYTRK